MNRVLVLFCVVLLLIGCGAAREQQTKNSLAPLSKWYHQHHEAHGQGPASWDALFSFVEKSGGDVASLKALQTDGLIVAWGYRFRDIVIGTSNFVLAYHPDAKTNGGMVLMMDTSTQQMTASGLSEALKKQSSIKPRPPR